jgi:hypothetical protein
MNALARQALSDYMCERLPDFYDPQDRTIDAVGLAQAALEEIKTDTPYYEVLNLAQGLIRQAALDYQTES